MNQILEDGSTLSEQEDDISFFFSYAIILGASLSMLVQGKKGVNKMQLMVDLNALTEQAKQRLMRRVPAIADSANNNGG